MFGHSLRISLPAAMLGLLLFGAGLAVKGEHLRGIFRHPFALVAGLAARVVVPVLLLIVCAAVVTDGTIRLKRGTWSWAWR